MKKRIKKLMVTYCFLGSALAISLPALSAVIHVSPAGGGNGSSGNPTDLQSALDTAEANSENDAIRLQQGTYTGNFTYTGISGEDYDLTIEGGWMTDFSSRTINPANTILDGNDTGRPLTLNNIPNQVVGSLKVEGLTLTQGLPGNNTAGGGLLAMAFPPGGIDIQQNIIRFNTAGSSGGGIMAASYDTASQSGGAINIASNIIYTNEGGLITDQGTAGGGGVFVSSAGTVTITNNLIYDNGVGNDTTDGRGGGLFLSAYDGEVYLINNTFVNNGAVTEAGGVYATEATEAWDVVNVQVYNNIIGGDPECKLFDCKEDFLNDISATVPAAGSSLTISNNNAEVSNSIGSITPTESNNITGDPLFVNETAGHEDFHLRKGSICVDTGTNLAPNMPSTDLDGQVRPRDGDGDGIATVNMGCYEKLGGIFNWTMFLPGIIRSGK